MYRSEQKLFGLDHVFGFQTQIFIQNLNFLQSNDYRLSKIQTNSDFGIPLYRMNTVLTQMIYHTCTNPFKQPGGDLGH